MLPVVQSFGRHFTYPHMTIASEDLLVVMRASADTGQMDVTANYYVRLVSFSKHTEGQTLEIYCIWSTGSPHMCDIICVAALPCKPQTADS